MYKNHNNEKNTPAPYLVGKKRSFALNIFFQKIAERFTYISGRKTEILWFPFTCS